MFGAGFFIIPAPNWKQDKCPSRGQWLVTHPMAPPFNGARPVLRGNSGLFNKVDEPQVHCTKRKSPDTKGYVLCDFMYMTFWERQNYSRKQISDHEWLEMKKEVA